MGIGTTTLREKVSFLIKKFNKLNSIKRVEENNKFIFKRTMKILRNRFYKTRNINHNKQNERLFFAYFF